MSLAYGFVKCTIIDNPTLKANRHKHEIQYHLHAPLEFIDQDGNTQQWDSAINVGTSDADDLLQYKLVFDFRHPIIQTLKAAKPGHMELSDSRVLPALDFLRSDVLANTGNWRDSDVMDGSAQVEPVASLERLLQAAVEKQYIVYLFGRRYTQGGDGIHDIHFNQGSSGGFINNGKDDHNDHNDVWQDGAVIVDIGQPEWVAYFTTFTQQRVPTDNLGNPKNHTHEMTVADEGSLAGG